MDYLDPPEEGHETRPLESAIGAIQLHSLPDLKMQKSRIQTKLERGQDGGLWRDISLSGLLQERMCRIRYMQFDKLIPGQLGEYDISPLDVTITCNMKID